MDVIRILMLSALGVALIVIAPACDDEVSAGGGGAGASSTGGGGAAGDPCDADPTCCPQTYPEHGASCEKTVSCPYSVGADCPQSVEVEASCDGGLWNALKLASCTPLDPGASCDPLGRWQVDYVQAGSGPPIMSPGFELEITTDGDGLLFMSAAGTIDATDGCVIMAQWSETDSGGDGDESWWTDIDDQLDLTISGDQATGTYQTTCEGECGWDATYPATATRITS